MGTVEHSTSYCYILVPARNTRPNMRLCLILIIAISALSTEATPNEDKQDDVQLKKSGGEVGAEATSVEESGGDNEGFENGYFGYGYGGGRGGGTRRYGAYGPAYGYGYGAYGAYGNRQSKDCCAVCFWCTCCLIIPG